MSNPRKMFPVLLHEDEKRLLERAAKKAKKPTSTWVRELALAAAAALLAATGCTAANPLFVETGVDVLEPAVDLLHASGDGGAPDLARGDRARLPDLLVLTQPDLVETVDMLTTSAVDMLACGRAGQPCCGFSCTETGAICLVDGDQCGAQVAHLCVRVGTFGCGTGAAAPCDDSGAPSSSGRCESGLRVWDGGPNGNECVACFQ